LKRKSRCLEFEVTEDPPERLFDHATIGVEHLRFETGVAQSEKVSDRA
jgi:hypothetical protein